MKMDDNTTIQDIIDTMTEEQKNVMYGMIGTAVEQMGGDDDMDENNTQEIKHSIFNEAKKLGSLKDSVIQHAGTYGIDQIEELLPDHKAMPVQTINNEVEWVNKLLSKVHKSPFARVKSLFVDISDATLRAKGYIKGKEKKEHVFELLKRTTEPTTIYTKQKLDRDDIIDVTDFPIVTWIKQEMEQKLNEELARAILIGDGRSNVDEDKIDEECIRPVVSDDDFYSVKVELPATMLTNNDYNEFVKTVVRNRKKYKGSGSPILFTTEDVIAELLLTEDSMGRLLYATMESLKSALRVSDIVPVQDLEGFVRPTSDGKTHTVYGILVNPVDYSLGADKGGEKGLFDDFDIDYNQYKYLLETRRSGALIKPFSALVIEHVQ